jgi:hypothetical protein
MLPIKTCLAATLLVMSSCHAHLRAHADDRQRCGAAPLLKAPRPVKR